KYRVGVDRAGSYAPGYFGGTSIATATTVAATDGPLQLEPIRLTAAARLMGRVTGNAGVEGVTVDVYDHDGWEGWDAVERVKAKNDGTFVVDGLAAGIEYRLRDSDARYFTIYSGGATNVESAAGITVRAGDNPVPDAA